MPKFPRDLRKFVWTLGFFIIFIIWTLTAPLSFPKGDIITVPEGSGLQSISKLLEEENIIRSPLWFRVSSILLGGERGMKAGEYYFSRPQSVLSVAWRIFRGDHGIETVRLTIPEGFTVKKISNLFDERFPYFDNEYFEEIAPEGYLFPDTYFMPVTATATSTIKTLRDNFNRKTDNLSAKILASGRSLEEVVKMASIIEAESNRSPDREIVSGILWKRIAQNVPLQVDASFVYVNGKTTNELTLDDLKIKSPYNTYINRGLPPTPISNPGLLSLEAALSPTSTPYFYFLTGKDGQMYYAKTFDEHVENKNKYLK